MISIFLTLLVPLLVHGAPGNENRPTGFDWLPETHQLANNVLPPPGPMPQAWSPPRHDSAPVLPLPIQGSQGTNPHAQPVGHTNVNWGVQTMPPATGGLPNTKPVHLTDDKLKNNCRFPKGTEYRTPPWPSIRELRETIGIRRDRVVITEENEIYLVPKGSNIEISNDNTVDVPTKVRKVDEKEVVRIKGLCKEDYDKTDPEPRLEPVDEYVLRCSDINYWNSDFKKVPVRRAKQGMGVSVPPGTTYHIPPSGRNIKLTKPTRTTVYWVATTPEGDVILIPEDTTVLISAGPGLIDLPRGNTKVRIIDKEDVKDIQTNCKAVRDRAEPPKGYNHRPAREYMTLCCDINFKNFPHGFVDVPVPFRRLPRSR